MSKTVIKSCTCSHEFQDKTYGRGMRVFNSMMAKGRVVGEACTVCSRESKAPVFKAKEETPDGGGETKKAPGKQARN